MSLIPNLSWNDLLGKKTTRCHWPKSAKVSWLRTPLIAYPDLSVSIRIWCFKSKWWRIGALRNACLNLVNANLALRVKKFEDPTIFLDLDGFLDLDVFWTFFPTSSSSISLPSILLPLNSHLFRLLPLCLALLSSPALTMPSPGCVADSILSEVFNTEISGAAIWLNPWINCW